MEPAAILRVDELPAYPAAYDAADEAEAAEWSAVFYPPYTAAQLREYLRRAVLAIAERREISLAAASEPGLYTLAAALFSAFRNGEMAPDAGLSIRGYCAAGADGSYGGGSNGAVGLADAGLSDAELTDGGLAAAELTYAGLTYAKLIDEVRRELGWRNCRAMGHNPTGAVRRGRLLQLTGSFTTLARRGASPLQRNRVSGDCPLCGGAAALSVFLDSVRWRCFGCGGQGGLPELAGAMLDCMVR